MATTVYSKALAGGGRGFLARAATHLTSDRLRFFATTWALATLFHVVGEPQKLFTLSGGFADFTSARSFFPAALLVAAAYLLLDPGKPVRLLMLATTQVLDYAINSPIASNHWTVAFYTALAIVISGALVLISRSPSRSLSTDDFYEYFAPVGRLVLLTMYVYGIFHKINADFLNPEVSCAIHLYGLLATPFGLSDALWAQYGAIYGTFLIEACALAFLAIPKLRYYGFAIGLPFHAAIAISGQSVVEFEVGGTFFDFSAVVFGLYALFLPAPFFARLREVFGNPRTFTPIVLGLGAATLAGLALLAAMFGTSYLPFHPRAAYLMAIGIACFVYGCAFWLAVLMLTRPRDFAPERRLLLPRHAAPAAIAVLFFLNGMSPYVGLKTESSIAMFSNLHTEGSVTNHLLFEQPPYLFSFQESLVEIKGSTDEVLQHHADRGRRLVEYEFWRHLRAHPEASVTYQLDGQTYTLERAGDHATAAAAAPWLLDKFLLFKPVDPARPKVCSH